MNTQQLSIHAAMNHPDSAFLLTEEIDFASSGLSPLQLVARFAWACGVGADSVQEVRDAVHDDVIGDGRLALALSGTPSTFATWFANEQWDIYELTEATGGEEWAAVALATARGAAAWPAWG